MAPAANAGLISYLWPLLIVILAGWLLPGERLRTIHLVSGVCGFIGAALLALACHLAWEPRGWPEGANLWAILALGPGPVGSAFFTWDLGMKRGHVRLLGLLSYATPLCSTLVLIAAGLAAPSPTLLLAALLICGCALIGSGMLGSRKSRQAQSSRG